MLLEFHGAADEVTGSLHRLHVGGLDIALDCGLFQGHRAEANRYNREVPPWAVSALVLSHAHLDQMAARHCGSVVVVDEQQRVVGLLTAGGGLRALSSLIDTSPRQR